MLVLIKHVACRDGSVKSRINVRLVDDSMRVISSSLWSEDAQILDDTEGRYMKVNNHKLGEFNGKKVLNSTPGTEAIATPLDVTMTEIQNWWNDGTTFEIFKEILFSSLTSLKSISCYAPFLRIHSHFLNINVSFVQCPVSCFNEILAFLNEYFLSQGKRKTSFRSFGSRFRLT